MSRKSIFKTIVLLLVPFLLFAVLVVPYSYLNQAVLVDWLGCGCPRVDEAGEMVEPAFNANNFTALFWLFVSACATVLSGFLTGKTPLKERKWLRIVCVAVTAAVSLLLSFNLYRVMMWN